MPGGYPDVTGYNENQVWSAGVVKCKLDSLIATPGDLVLDVDYSGLGTSLIYFYSTVNYLTWVGPPSILGNWSVSHRGIWREEFSLQDYYDVLNGDAVGTWMTPEEYWDSMSPDNPTAPVAPPFANLYNYDGTYYGPDGLEFFVMDTRVGRWIGSTIGSPATYLKHKRAMAFMYRTVPLLWRVSKPGTADNQVIGYPLPFSISVARSEIDGYVFADGPQWKADFNAYNGTLLPACYATNPGGINYTRFNIWPFTVTTRWPKYHKPTSPYYEVSPTKTSQWSKGYPRERGSFEQFLGQPWDDTDPVIGIYSEAGVPGFSTEQANAANTLWECAHNHSIRWIMAAYINEVATCSGEPGTEDLTVLVRRLDDLVDEMVTNRDNVADWRAAWRDVKVLVTDQDVPGTLLEDIDFGSGGGGDADKVVDSAVTTVDPAPYYEIDGWDMILARRYGPPTYVGSPGVGDPSWRAGTIYLHRDEAVYSHSNTVTWQPDIGLIPNGLGYNTDGTMDVAKGSQVFGNPEWYDRYIDVISYDLPASSNPATETIVFDQSGYDATGHYERVSWDPTCCHPPTTGRTLLWIDPLNPTGQVDPDGTYADRYRSRAGENLFRADFLHSFAGNGTSSGGPFLSLSEVSPGLNDSLTFLKAASQADPSIWRYPIRMFILPSVYGSNAPTPEPKTRAHFYASGAGYWPTEDDPDADPFFVLPYRGIERWAAAIKKGIEDGSMAKDTFDQQDEGCLLIIYVRDGLIGDQVIGEVSPWFASELSRYDTIYRRALTLTGDTAAETRSRGGVMAAEMGALMSNQAGHPANIVISVYDGTGPGYYKFIDWNFIRSKNKQDIYGRLRAGNRVSYSVPEDLGLLDVTVRTYLDECFNKWLPEVWQSANVDNKVGLQAGSWNW